MPPKGQPNGDPRLKLAARRKLRRLTAELGAPCRHCGRPIDFSGPWDLDEVLPRAMGGDPLDPGNVAPAHVRCNRRAGARMTAARREVVRPVTARRW